MDSRSWWILRIFHLKFHQAMFVFSLFPCFCCGCWCCCVCLLRKDGENTGTMISPFQLPPFFKLPYKLPLFFFRVWVCESAFTFKWFSIRTARDRVFRFRVKRRPVQWRIITSTTTTKNRGDFVSLASSGQT